MVIKMMREERQRIQVLKKQRKHRDVLLPQKIKPRNRFVGVLHDSIQQPLCQQYDSIGFFTVTDFFIRNTEPVESTIQYFLQTYRAIEPTNHLLPKQVRNRYSLVLHD